MVVIAAGLTGYRTVAAGEFLAGPAYLESLSKHSPRHWATKNMQIVVATKVINGNSARRALMTSIFGSAGEPGCDAAFSLLQCTRLDTRAHEVMKRCVELSPGDSFMHGLLDKVQAGRATK